MEPLSPFEKPTSADSQPRPPSTASEVRDGLSETEARKRLAQFGFKELVEEAVHPLRQFLSYFWGPIPWMIEAAAILSASVRDWTDFGIILILLIGNAVVGFWEEYQAGNAIAALKARLALRARVKRESAWKTIPARELVPGDVIRLCLGDIVPADGGLARFFAVFTAQNDTPERFRDRF